MRFEKIGKTPLTATGTTPSGQRDVEHYEQVAIQLTGTWTGSVTVDGSLDDGTTWSPIITVIGNGFVFVPGGIPLVRLNPNVGVGQTVSGYFGGRNSRTE